MSVLVVHNTHELHQLKKPCPATGALCFYIGIINLCKPV